MSEGKMPELIASTRRQLVGQFEGKANPDDPEPPRRGGGSLAWLTPVADRNGDGKLDRKELDAWLDLQQQVTRGQVLVTILDGGGLFELLDTNHDGALSVRELRGVWDRVRDAGCTPGSTFDRTKLPRTVLAAASHGYPQSFGIDLRGGPAWFRAMDKNGDGDVSRKEFTGPPEVFDKTRPRQGRPAQCRGGGQGRREEVTGDPGSRWRPIRRTGSRRRGTTTRSRRPEARAPVPPVRAGSLSPGARRRCGSGRRPPTGRCHPASRTARTPAAGP